MASVSEIVARLTLNAKDFTSKFEDTVKGAADKADAAGKRIGAAFGDKARSGLDSLASGIPGIGDSLTGLGGAAGIAAAGVGALVIGIGAAVSITEEYQQQARQLDAILKATGNTTGFSSQALRDYAEELETTFAIEAETFLQAEAVLSSFGGVAGTTFKRAIADAGDLAAVYGGDLPSNAEKLGTVLQNLAEGNVAGLSKGFKFLGDAQLDVIARLAESGETYKAQVALLDALEAKVGGAGAAKSKGVTGAFFRMADAVADTARTFAEKSGLYDAFVDQLDSIADSAGRAADRLAALPKNAGFLATLEASGLLDTLPGGATGNAFGSGARAASAARPGPIAGGYDLGFGNPQIGRYQFPGDPIGQRGIAAFGEDLSASRAAADGKAKGDAERARAAADDAAKKAAAAADRAADAARREAEQRVKLGQALEADVAKFERQAQLVGQTKEESALVTREAELQLKYGNLYNDALRKRVVLATSLEGLLTTGQTELQASLKTNATTALPGGQSLDAYFQHQLQDFDRERKEIDDRAAARAREQERVAFSFADHFETALLGGVDAVRDRFRSELGSAISGFAGRIAASLAGGGNGDVGVNAKALAESAKTAGIEFVLAAALAPLEPTIGAVANGISKVVEYLSPASWLQKAILGAHDEAFQVITSSGLGELGGVKGANKAKNRAAAESEGTSAYQALTSLASTLGAYLKPGVNLGAVGFYDGKYSFDTTPGSGNNRKIFDSQDKAITAFLQNAVKTGAVDGLDPATARLLGSGDLSIQLPKAVKLAGALKEINGGNNAFAEVVGELNKQFKELADVMAEAGSSVEDTAKASALYETRLQAIREAAGGAASTLKSFLDDIGFGSASPLGLRDQEAAAKANYAARAATIGTSGFDQQAFVSAGQRLLDIEGQINGRTGDFFTTYNQVRADTDRAINAINSAISITADNPFVKKTAEASAATADNTSMMAETLQAILAQLAAGGFGGGGAANDRGFVVRAVA